MMSSPTADRSSRYATATVFVHVLDTDRPAALDAARRSVWRMERLTVRAFGTRDEIARVAEPPPPPPLPLPTPPRTDGPGAGS